MNPWLSLLRPGDWAAAGLAAVAVAASFPLLWQGGAADKAVVRRNGEVVAELDLSRTRTLAVAGALGTTVIAVEPGRARVAADPGPRQYCVRQGWLRRPGEIAICAPNHVSLQIAGRNNGFDSLAY
ncbi:NusG domain II-containing protein [Azospira restricta]|uniref:NusG domain II-containing protein n=1 Tax=Azospira restricta TaxID=404405 RepID=A0A974SQL6_9RHOO|nr:NusG domain II-containing protein [Azospira restricta]QRJ64543.1 NusG domain II-containing protein [Azospira restricta]